MQTVFICISIDISWVTAIAGATSLTVNYYLSVKADRSWGSKVIKDVETISYC